MRTNIDIDDKTLKSVQKLGKHATKRDAVHAALAEYEKLLLRLSIRDLRGKIRWDGNLDQMRSARVPAAE